MEYSGVGGKLIHEKNQKQKISWHCPFKGIVLQNFLACHPDVIPPRRKSDYPDQNSSFSPWRFITCLFICLPVLYTVGCGHSALRHAKS